MTVFNQIRSSAQLVLMNNLLDFSRRNKNQRQMHFQRWHLITFKFFQQRVRNRSTWRTKNLKRKFKLGSLNSFGQNIDSYSLETNLMMRFWDFFQNTTIYLKKSKKRTSLMMNCPLFQNQNHKKSQILVKYSDTLLFYS